MASYCNDHWYGRNNVVITASMCKLNHCVLQANVYCTPRLAIKVVLGLVLFSLTAKAFRHTLEYFADVRIIIDIYIVLFNVIVPVGVLVINVLVVRKVRQASHTAVEHLGRQRSHERQQQSTSSNTAVPTVMLLATSLIYVLICGTCSFFYILTRWLPHTAVNHDTGLDLRQFNRMAFAWRDLIYAYNFFVYLITGQQFRLELKKLFCLAAVAPVISTENIRLSIRSQTIAQV